ncbi:MAG: histidine phosphatase family protein [Clostridia bacterium]|nr:histidine phosphatase family protein [Clostridia bacterium]
MTRLMLIRHGETMWNRERRLQGRSDVPLSDLGRAQAVAGARYMGESRSVGRVSLVYASPQSRAAETARPIAEALRVPIEFDDRLMEVDIGRLSGLTWDEVLSTYVEFAEAHRRNPLSTKYLGGESLLDVQARAANMLGSVIKEHENAAVVLVAHGIVLKALICLILGADVGTHRRIALGNASLTIAEISSAEPVRGKLLRLNDRHYLERDSLWSPGSDDEVIPFQPRAY